MSESFLLLSSYSGFSVPPSSSFPMSLHLIRVQKESGMSSSTSLFSLLLCGSSWAIVLKLDCYRITNTQEKSLRDMLSVNMLCGEIKSHYILFFFFIIFLTDQEKRSTVRIPEPTYPTSFIFSVCNLGQDISFFWMLISLIFFFFWYP